ncbi:RNA polymerase sigma factor [Kangiella sediminilitoris]|uniref:ECF subfamily RNA polymerase sigma-24 subunit n=1 Tax=Kangiella sediminilitoris TaxID=1144748 RepID=A0A1B3BCT9_9GAMM|nr:sigma-70 family RNA polymerase sigma factor [Kangiella sediminilitoris]AOE50557.1 ECF subfamily RNA polymerase sigma-24 subunit [Kangiella sediminilitoris]
MSAAEVTKLQTQATRELVKQAQDGSVSAFEGLYREHSNQVFLLCLRMSGCKSYAEDFMQETFIKAWQSLNSFKGDSRFSTWIYRIAVNTVLADKRKKSLDLVRDPDWEREFEQSLNDSHNRQQIDLEKAIATLPSQARHVLVLHDLMGMTHQEIGSQLDIAPGTSKAHLSRARTMLRETLE